MERNERERNRPHFKGLILHGLSPRAHLAVAGFSLPLSLGLFIMLAFLLLSITLYPRPSTQTAEQIVARWWPELLLVAASLIYTLLAVISSRFIRRALTYQYLRSAPLVIVSVVLLMEGIRLTSAALTQTGDLIVGISVLLSGLVLSRAYGDTRRYLQDLRSGGSLAGELDERSWQWSGKQFSQLETDRASKERGRQSRQSMLWRLHWLAPAAGIMVGRYFARDVSVLIVGAGFLLLGLLMVRETMKELALSREVLSWHQERKSPLKLKDAQSQ